MGRKNFNAFLKRQKAEKKRKRKDEKRLKKEERKKEESSGQLKDMIAYLDEEGNIISEPPEEKDRNAKDQNNNAGNKTQN